MNYEANTVRWKPGDLVLHDCDAKRDDMLMRVVGYRESDGLCQTEYVEPEKRSRWGEGKRSRLFNPLEYLHDPERFGVDVTKPDPDAPTRQAFEDVTKRDRP